MNCLSCGNPIPPGARFCPACGQAVAGRGDERRVATVLFADLVGFTSIAETLDPENVKNLVDECFERLVSGIESHGGRVDKIVGDAIIALFGAPIAHEDDAERAVRAALLMQETMVEHSSSLGVEVRMRIGVNTGEVLVGALKAGGDYTAMGDVINVASRLESSAQPGEVLVGPETQAVTRDVVRYEPVGSLDVKGREEPIEAYRAVEALLLPGSRPQGRKARLAGRDIELGLLERLIGSTVKRSRPHMAMLLGEAGVGKTRLAHEVAHRARSEYGALVIEGRCLPYGEANVWWPIASAIRDAIGIGEGDTAAVAQQKCRDAVDSYVDTSGENEAARAARGLIYLMGLSGGAAAAADPVQAGETAVEAALALIKGIVATRPTVLTLGELHWADPVVLEFIDRLLETVREAPLMVLALGRSELEERWSPHLGGWSILALTLEPLDDAAAAEMLADLLGDDPPYDLREFLLDRSGGNPFFLEELVSLLTETGVISRSDGELVVDPTKEFREMPATLRGLVSARLDSLAPEERSAVEDAAVIGPGGRVEWIVAMQVAGGAQLGQEIIDSLVLKSLLDVNGDEFEFKSDLTREVAYKTLTKGERARRHGQFGRLLEALARDCGREDELLEQLAHHFGRAARYSSEVGGAREVGADVIESALHWTERAADRALYSHWSTDAERLFNQLLVLTPDHSSETARRALLGRGTARGIRHEIAAARADLEELVSIAKAVDDRVTEARAYTQIGDVERLAGNLAEAGRIFTMAIGMWRDLGDAGGEADALRAWAMSDIFGGVLEEGTEKTVQALEISREIGDKRGEASAYQSLGWIAFRRGDPVAAEAWIGQALALFGELGDEGGADWAIGLLAWLRFTQGRRDEAAEMAELLRDRLERGEGMPWGIAMMNVLLSQLALADGNVREAVQLADDAHGVFASIDDRWGTVQGRVAMSLALVASGRVDDALRALADATAIAEKLEDDYPITLISATSAGIALQIGDAETAMANIQRAVEVGDMPTGSAGPELRAREMFAALLIGDLAEALELGRASAAAINESTFAAAFSSMYSLVLAANGEVSEAREVALNGLDLDGWAQDRIRGHVALGLAAAQLGDGEDSDSNLAAAAGLAERCESRLEQAKALLATGYARRRLGIANAEEVLADAHESLKSLGIDDAAWSRVYGAAANGGITDEATVVGAGVSDDSASGVSK